MRTDGTSYDGFFKDNLFCEKGKFIFADEDQEGRKAYTGCFMNGLFHGPGTMTLQNGDHYWAKWDQGAARGQGKLKVKRPI